MLYGLGGSPIAVIAFWTSSRATVAQQERTTGSTSLRRSVRFLAIRNSANSGLAAAAAAFLRAASVALPVLL